ncbi:OCIA domain-containing protein 1 [Galendromus occidentalis]|uniref:OCIA domain-containing protein 1 n=1 Tax=Galendromus occidentalis TaxID=34638 RepID=A0AAJ6QQF4_9ACAR|nr:OCIA domain-containing protein 1 [Galendromus occidentalis]
MTAYPNEQKYFSADQDRRVAAPVNPNDISRRGREPVKLSPEDIAVLKECDSESFYQRSLPLMAGYVIGAEVAFRKGLWQPNASFGKIPKMAAGLLGAYIFGRISYISVCTQRLKDLPNSEFGELLRKKAQGGFDEGGQSGFDQLTGRRDEPAPRASPYPYQPPREEIVHERAGEEQPGRKKSFEDLRNENRLMHAHNQYSQVVQQYGGSGAPPPQSPAPSPNSQPESFTDPFAPLTPPERDDSVFDAVTAKPKRVRRNAYGDVFEE